ncbi:SH3 domain-binding glutamic acid-rich-like protein 3 [Nematolebias whitei]|uniref:SH3 domain-binding glutamic acid-rich-like protein 3 n=1 Tax=Nematolebias whitei TaxID=451745 RepID=UPI001899B994|nr:SH3 domain-binding glutamic acid-rich-like protein 3 [Nematolebias whitei]
MQAGKLRPNLLTLSAASADSHIFIQNAGTLPAVHFSVLLLCSGLCKPSGVCSDRCASVKAADMPVIVYYASVSGSLELKKNQERIMSVLTSKKIPYETKDITQNSADKDAMRKKAGNPTAMPPQICNGDVYCGDFAAFENAIEDNQLEEFLKLGRKA